MLRVKKAIVPIAGLGTRFLPLSKILSKEFFPLADLPVLQYILEELKNSGIEEIIFVNRPEKRKVLDYFKGNKKLESILRKRKKTDLLKELLKLDEISKRMSFSEVFQGSPMGAAHAVLQAKKKIGKEPCAVLWSDDVVESKTPCTYQLIKTFKKYKKPVVALYRIRKEDFKHYGMADVKKISPGLFRINGFIEKPSVKESPSNLAVVGKYILTPKVFDYLGKTRFSLGKDISLTDTLSQMAKAGEEILGLEFEGKWLECGNKLAYLKSNFYLSLKHPKFGKELKKFLKKEKLV